MPLSTHTAYFKAKQEAWNSRMSQNPGFSPKDEVYSDWAPWKLR